MSPAVRAVVQPAPIAVSACDEHEHDDAAPHPNRVYRQTASSQASPASRLRSATVRADCVSSSETHCLEAPR